MDYPSQKDEELMAAYVAGDDRAYAALYERLAPWLLRVMAHQLSRPEDARDLVQQSFLQAHVARHDFQAGARLRPWLVTIALNLKRGYFRRRKRHPEHAIGEAAEVAGATDSPEKSAEASRLRAALTELPEPQREVLVLHYFAGFSYGEISAVTGTGLSAVKQRARRAYGRLREQLAVEE